MSQTAAPTRAPGAIASHKIQPRHLERAAVVYVHQSTVQQILRHQESTKIQYGLADLAERLGWMKEQVVVIDDDLGVSGASSESRAGFQRLLADVALDRVGLMAQDDEGVEELECERGAVGSLADLFSRLPRGSRLPCGASKAGNAVRLVHLSGSQALSLMWIPRLAGS